MKSKLHWLSPYEKLESRFKSKPIGKIYKIKYGKWGQLDGIVRRYDICLDCDHITSGPKCSRCKSSTTKMYEGLVCKYSSGNCTVNRWGCSIHFRVDTSHPFTCTCDSCY